MRLRNMMLLVVVFAIGFLSAQAFQVGVLRQSAAPRQAAAGGPGPSAAAEPAADASPEPAASPAAESANLADDDLTSEETRNIGIFRRASASVVNITNIALRRDFFSMDVFQMPQGTGSGFIWDEQGHIVTNYHVVENANSLSVTLADQTEADATVVGVAPDKDLAVLQVKVKPSLLVTLPLGRSSGLQVGQTVLALGNPFGLDHSLTVGIVSALGRELQSPGGRTIRDVIQTDAAINPGNSGGPLLDSHGRLIGVNSAIYSPSGANAGIGFAVPVDTVKRMVPQLIEHGKPIQAGIGVSLLNDQTAARIGVKGAVIYEVKRGGPADRAGLEGVHTGRSGRAVMGDLIVAVNGKKIDSGDDLFHTFEAIGVGGRVTLTVERDKKSRDVELTLVALE